MAANTDVLSDINKIRKENRQLATKLEDYKKNISSPPTNLAGLHESFKVHGTYKYGDYTKNWEVILTWAQIFGKLAPFLRSHPHDESVKSQMKSMMKKQLNNNALYFYLDSAVFETISIQLKALGLVNVKYSKTTKGGYLLFWSLTQAGEQLMIDLRTVRKD